MAGHEDWAYARNQFEIATRNNMKKAYTIGNYTFNALAADPDAADDYEEFRPFYLAFIGQYNAKNVQGGIQKSKTQIVNELLEQGTANMEDWLLDIKRIHKKGTPGYVALFPRGMEPFNQGRKDLRIAAYKTLAMAMAGQPLLAPVKSSIEAYHLQLEEAEGLQEGAISNSGQQRNDLEPLRVEMCDYLYRSLGGLMKRFFKNPKRIEDYFLLSEIRNFKQTHFTGHVAADVPFVVAERTLVGDDVLVTKNLGAVPFDVYLAANKGDRPAGIKTTILPNETKEMEASSAGNLSNHFISIYQNNDGQTAQFELDIN